MTTQQFSSGAAQYPPAQHIAPSVYDAAAAHYPTQATLAQAAMTSQQAVTAQQTAYAQQSAFSQVVAVQRAISAQHNASAAPGANPSQAPPSQPSVYPTTPPWATEQQPAPAPQIPAYQAPVIGGLLVPFPEEMSTAARAQAPAVWPVAAWTFFFGLFAVFSAARRAGRARRGGNKTAPYWITWGVSLFAAYFIWFVLSVTVIQPALNSVLSARTLAAVEHNVVSDGQLAKANLSATSATCRAISDPDTEGGRDYLCTLNLKDGSTGQLRLNADRYGNWTALSS